MLVGGLRVMALLGRQTPELPAEVPFTEIGRRVLMDSVR